MPENYISPKASTIVALEDGRILLEFVSGTDDSTYTFVLTSQQASQMSEDLLTASEG